MKVEHSPKFPILVPGVGPVPAPGMIIGEAPGRNEIKNGIPFCGSSGYLLDKTFGDFGAASGDYFTSNSFMGDVGTGNADPTRDMLDDHRPILFDEIEMVDPVCILLLGKVACLTFGLGGPMYDMPDKVWYDFGSDKPKPLLIPCYHPAAALRDPKYIEPFRYSVARFILLTETLERARHGRQDRNPNWDSGYEYEI